MVFPACTDITMGSLLGLLDLDTPAVMPFKMYSTPSPNEVYSSDDDEALPAAASGMSRPASADKVAAAADDVRCFPRASVLPSCHM
jgi:hypothetical protein